jgi:RNase P subunit RPR2
MLFTHACTECSRTQLIFPSQANGVLETDRGPALLFTCWCGAEQAHQIGERPLVGA